MADIVNGSKLINLNLLAQYNTQLNAKIAEKYVAKEEGKGLISDSALAKLNAIAEGATKVEASETNGNIVINGEEVVVYTPVVASVDEENVAHGGILSDTDYQKLLDIASGSEFFATKEEVATKVDTIVIHTKEGVEQNVSITDGSAKINVGQLNLYVNDEYQRSFAPGLGGSQVSADGKSFGSFALNLKGDKDASVSLGANANGVPTVTISTDLSGKADLDNADQEITLKTVNGKTVGDAISKGVAEEISSESDNNSLATAGAVYQAIKDFAPKASVFMYKGSVASLDEIAEMMGAEEDAYEPKVGDVWNIEEADEENDIKAGDNVVYNGEGWDNLSGIFDLSGYVTKDALTTFYVASNDDITSLFAEEEPSPEPPTEPSEEVNPDDVEGEGDEQEPIEDESEEVEIPSEDEIVEPVPEGEEELKPIG